MQLYKCVCIYLRFQFTFYQPEVSGVDGLLEAYQQTIHNVELYGPTNFSPVYLTIRFILVAIFFFKDELYINIMDFTHRSLTKLQQQLRRK